MIIPLGLRPASTRGTDRLPVNHVLRPASPHPPKNMIRCLRQISKILGVLAAVVVLPILGYQYLAFRANETLLQKLAMAKPGVPLAKIRDSLGTQMYVFDDLDLDSNRASVTNPEFLKDKRLYWFYASAPPCRAIEIYTDKEDVILFATWISL